MKRFASILIAIVVAPACITTGPPPAGPIPDRGPEIVIGSFHFTESELLAHLYAGALRSRGLSVRVLAGVGPREILAPGLEQGVVDVVPEYLGTALGFFDPDSAAPGLAPAATHRVLADALRDRGLIPLDFAPAENKNEFVVTRETADRFELAQLTDLRSVAERFTFGGPVECPARPLCLDGLQRIYGLYFESFVTLDAGGPLTATALNDGVVDVALMFTTTPAIGQRGLVVLDDNFGLQPAENIVPIVRKSVVARHGTRLIPALNSVSERLRHNDLVALNELVTRGASPQEAAEAWLSEHNLALPPDEKR
jgi:osmoprotectant transport system substrate-binding protein